MRSARPDDQPRLRPTDQLVAAERDEVGAGGQALGGRRLVGEPEGGRLEQRPAPEVVDDDRAVRVGERVRARPASGASTNPVWAKFDGWTRRTTVARPSASGASKSAARVRFVVPTSISRAPVRRTISGMRTPPPISTSSPRETATPCLPASPTASTSAAALLTVTSASSAPVSAIRWSSAARNRGPAPTGLAVEFEQRVRRRRHVSPPRSRPSATVRARGSYAGSPRSR